MAVMTSKASLWHSKVLVAHTNFYDPSPGALALIPIKLFTAFPAFEPFPAFVLFSGLSPGSHIRPVNAIFGVGL